MTGGNLQRTISMRHIWRGARNLIPSGRTITHFGADLATTGRNREFLLHLAVFAEESRSRLARCATQRGLPTSRQVGVPLRHAAVRISAVGIAVEVLELLIAVMSSSIGWM